MKLTDISNDQNEIDELDFIIKEPRFHFMRGMVNHLIKLGEKKFSREFDYILAKNRALPLEHFTFNSLRNPFKQPINDYIFYKFLDYRITKDLFIIDEYMEHCDNINKPISDELDDVYMELHFKVEFLNIKLKEHPSEIYNNNESDISKSDQSTRSISYLKFIAIDNSLTDTNILEDFQKLDFTPMTIDDVSFYFSQTRFNWFLELCDNKQLFTAKDEEITRENLNSYFKVYGKGFREGFFNYLDNIENENSLFKDENKILVNKIFSKVYNALNVSFLPIEIKKDNSSTKKEHRLIEKDLFSTGAEDGEIYKAWCVIAEYSPMFEEVWSKNNYFTEPTNNNVENNISILKWHGSKSELIELTKSLIENGNFKGNQKDIFEKIESIFGIELKNVDQAITKFNNRNSGNETKFLDKLKKSLSQYISSKLEKNR